MGSREWMGRTASVLARESQCGLWMWIVDVELITIDFADGQDEAGLQGSSGAMYLVGLLSNADGERCTERFDGDGIVGQDDQGMGCRGAHFEHAYCTILRRADVKLHLNCADRSTLELDAGSYRLCQIPARHSPPRHPPLRLVRQDHRRLVTLLLGHIS